MTDFASSQIVFYMRGRVRLPRIARALQWLLYGFAMLRVLPLAAACGLAERLLHRLLIVEMWTAGAWRRVG